MLNINSYLNTPMAYYVAGLATADYLIGENPEAIHRWDSFAASDPLDIAHQSKKLVVLGTQFTPILVSDVLSRDEVKRAKATALNTAFVALSGVAGMQGVAKFRNETAQPLINLVASDLNRAAGIIGSVSAPELGASVALHVLEATMRFFKNPDVADVVETLAHDVLRNGGILENDDFLLDTLCEIHDLRAHHPKTIIEWPAVSSRSFSLWEATAFRDENGPV